MLLGRVGVEFVELAPTRYFDLKKPVESRKVIGVRDFWESEGLRVAAMQSVFYQSGFNLFASKNVRREMLEWFHRVCEIAQILGSKFLVLGAGANRDPGQYGLSEASQIAGDFFSRLGDVAAEYDQIACIEPSPIAYGGRYLVSAAEVRDFVELLGHPNLLMQFDSGSLEINGELNFLTVERVWPMIGHVHLSAPNLVPLQLDPSTVNNATNLLRQIGCEKGVTVEMLPDKSFSVLEQIQSAADYVISGFADRLGE